jgi:glycosyltransferase involved in cell wall biosynthesis
MNPRIALLTGSLPPHDVCGVGDYTDRLHQALSERLPVALAHVPIRRHYEPALFRAFRGQDLVHVQYPTEGWGNSLLPSLLGRGRRGTKLLLTLHEWSQMNPIRRTSLRPLLAAADGFVFVTPYERDAFAADMPGLARRPTWVVPIGVNLTVPAVPAEEVLAYRTEALGARFDFLVTHFGFLHAAKQPEKLLAAMRDLRDRGRRPRLVVIGGFKDEGPARRRFLAGIENESLGDAVVLEGFVKDDRRAALVMAAADANVSLFAEGLSSRRGSFWYAAQHGNTLVTTTPRDLREFADVAERLRPPQVSFVQPAAPPERIADALAALPPYLPFRYPRIPAPEWSEIAARHVEIYGALLSR